VSVAGSVSYEEHSVPDLQRALDTVESAIIALENPSGICRVLPRYR
jgi:hypothetical protein